MISSLILVDLRIRPGLTADVTLQEWVSCVARPTATVGTVTDGPTLGKGTTCTWTGIHTTLILASAIGGTVIVGGTLGTTGGRDTIIVG